MGKFRIMLIPGSDCETVIGKGLEKSSVVVTDPCGCLGNTLFSETIQHSVVVGRRFQEMTACNWGHTAFPTPDLLLPAPVSAFLTNWGSQETIPQVKLLCLASLKMCVELLLEYQGCGRIWLGSIGGKSSGRTNLTCVGVVWRDSGRLSWGTVLWPVLVVAPMQLLLPVSLLPVGKISSGRLSLFCKLRPFLPTSSCQGFFEIVW